MKKILFILLLIVLWCPMLQEKYNFIDIPKLTGVVIPPSKPELNNQNWFDGSYQKDYEKLYDSEYGCREFFIRLFNQINFSLFRFTTASVVFGKDDYLFEQGYLDEIIGNGYSGKEHLKSMLENVEDVQQYLAGKNILLVTLLAPGKSYYYHEYMPDYYQKKIGNDNDYGELIHLAKDYNVNMIDANGWFLKMKDTTHLPLFPKQGIHWNFYGMAIVADSVVKYVEAKTHTHLGHFKYTIDFPEVFQGTDNDFGELLNLLIKQKNPLMPYPRITFDKLKHNKLRLLTVGDSFYWTILDSKIFNNAFDSTCYYYYNHTIYDDYEPRKEQPSDYNILREINKYDVIFLIQSTRHYYNLGTGFIQLIQKNIKKRNELFAKYLVQIKNENQYPELISGYSHLHNVSTDSSSSFIADSLAMSYMDQLSAYKITIRNSPGWLAQLVDKSKQKGISLEEMMDTDAEWMMEQKK